MGRRLGGGKLKATENEIVSANSLVEEDSTVTTVYTNQPHYYNPTGNNTTAECGLIKMWIQIG